MRATDDSRAEWRRLVRILRAEGFIGLDAGTGDVIRALAAARCLQQAAFHVIQATLTSMLIAAFSVGLASLDRKYYLLWSLRESFAFLP